MPRLFKEVCLTAERPLKADDRLVENMSRVVCSLLILGLQKMVKTPDFWKISIEINHSDISENQKVLLGVLIVHRKFPVREFLSWQIGDRQSYMLNFVSDTLKEVFIERGLDIFDIDEAIEYVKQRKFLNVIAGREKFSNPFGGEVVHIECEQEMDEARIYAVAVEKKSQARKVFIATTVPEEFIFQIYFGRIEWSDSSHPILHRADGELIPIDNLTVH